jgi:hypothetical protein
MKKIFILSVFTLAFSLLSCTTDSLPKTSQANQTAGDIGGQNGQIPVNPPKP